MSIATILTPRMIVIGGGAVAQVADVLRQVGGSRALVVTDKFMVASGKIAACTDALAKGGVAFDVFSDTIEDPTTTVVEAGVAALQAGGYDSLVAFGGGSPIDTAKAMSVLAANGGRMRDYKTPNPIPKQGIPLVAIPTTAGTGSEVTRFTIITDVETDEKMLIAGVPCLPAAALVDYELTLTKPFRLTADTGIDSLTHAIEAYVSKRASPHADSLAKSAMRLIHDNIRKVCADPADRAAREAMMLAATQAGMAFSNSSVALVHGMSRPIGAFFHVPHGLSNAMLLPAITAFSANAALDRYADCARAMGLAGGEVSDQTAVAILLDALAKLNADLKVPTPKAHGLDESRYMSLLPTMAEQALASGSPNNNPRVPTKDEIVELYKRVWA
ncbi:MAG: iron-containing alcohol dehydrogenase [Rhodospirillales bacterium]|nr:MAG: iron-containing alcohol dehydrogenase [Rhodospirillales bacterium]